VKGIKQRRRVNGLIEQEKEIRCQAVGILRHRSTKPQLMERCDVLAAVGIRPYIMKTFIFTLEIAAEAVEEAERESISENVPSNVNSAARSLN
jgi:hypothetical protein